MAVMMIHVSGQSMWAAEPLSYPWAVFTAFNYMGSWAVPMFVMISGALFLDNGRPLKLDKLYKGNLFRLVTAFFFWSAVYALEKYLKYHDLRQAVEMFLAGRYHMWYLLLTIGLYISVPVIRKITESREITEYFLTAGFFLVVLIPDIVEFLQWIDLPHTGFVLGILKTNLNSIQYPLGSNFLFYFVLGFYLTHFELRQRWIRCGYLFGVFGYLSGIFLEVYHAYITGADDLSLSLRLNTLAMTVGMFFFAKYVLGKIKLTESASRLLRNLSNYTFGAYLVHALVLSQLRDQLNLTTLSFDPLVSVLVVESCVVIISFAVSMLLNQIPGLKKYIV